MIWLLSQLLLLAKFERISKTCPTTTTARKKISHIFFEIIYLLSPLKILREGKNNIYENNDI